MGQRTGTTACKPAAIPLLALLSLPSLPMAFEQETTAALGQMATLVGQLVEGHKQLSDQLNAQIVHGETQRQGAEAMTQTINELAQLAMNHTQHLQVLGQAIQDLATRMQTFEQRLLALQNQNDGKEGEASLGMDTE